MSNMLCIAKLTHTYCYYADDVVFQIWICHKIKATFSDFLRWLLLGIEIVIYIIYWPVKSHIRLTESMKESFEILKRAYNKFKQWSMDLEWTWTWQSWIFGEKLVSKTFRVVRALHVSGIGTHSIVLDRGESMSGCFLLKEENKYINRAPSKSGAKNKRILKK